MYRILRRQMPHAAAGGPSLRLGSRGTEAQSGPSGLHISVPVVWWRKTEKDGRIRFSSLRLKDWVRSLLQRYNGAPNRRRWLENKTKQKTFCKEETGNIENKDQGCWKQIKILCDAGYRDQVPFMYWALRSPVKRHHPGKLHWRTKTRTRFFGACRRRKHLGWAEVSRGAFYINKAAGEGQYEALGLERKPRVMQRVWVGGEVARALLWKPQSETLLKAVGQQQEEDCGQLKSYDVSSKARGMRKRRVLDSRFLTWSLGPHGC